MEDSIRLVVEATVAEGKLDSFKRILSSAVERVRANEPNTLSYEFFFNEDESKCYGLEWYKDSEATIAHVANVGEILGRLFEVSQLTRMEVMGAPSDEAKKLLDSFGAQTYIPWDGLTR